METPVATAPGDPEGVYQTIPDYLGSLDAMHEAEKALNPSQLTFYYATLTMKHGSGNMRVISAPAPQRAEAFLRALNLYTP